MIKCVFLLRRQPHLSREEFLAYWRNKHAPLAQQVSGTMRMKRYVQLHPLDHPMGALLAQSRNSKLMDWDGITECWWDSFDDLALVAGSAGEIAEKVLADEKSFVDLSRSEMMFFEENEVVG